ncbi:unnamed protein product [Arabidopsis halleri]
MTEKKFPFHDHPLSYEKMDMFSCIFATFGGIRDVSSAHSCIHLHANILSRSTQSRHWAMQVTIVIFVEIIFLMIFFIV